MNTYCIIILAAVTGSWLLQTAAAVLGLGRTGAPLPAGTGLDMEPARRERMQRYVASGMRLNIAEDTAGTAVFLVFWLCGALGSRMRCRGLPVRCLAALQGVVRRQPES